MKLTEQEINEIVESNPQLKDVFCRMLVYYMMGYLRHADNIENTRQDFFKQIKAHIDKNKPAAVLPSILPSEENKRRKELSGLS